jgi:8-oxo-dGTP diphosphatase
MMHRIKKENDENHDKWIGVGGKIEAGESPFDAARREIFEECALTPSKLDYRGIITFVSDEWGTEYMHLFTSSDFVGAPSLECDEGVLEWVKKEDIPSLPIWEGDKIFLSLLDTEKRFFSLKLIYQGEKLVEHILEI